MKILTQFLLGFATIVLLDIAWIGYIANSLYKGRLGPLMREKALLLPAVLTWLTIVAGVWFFVIQHPSVDSVKGAAMYGAAFGFISYAIYELTNQAVIKNRQPEMVIVDILWGTVLCAVVAVVMFAAGSKIM